MCMFLCLCVPEVEWKSVLAFRTMMERYLSLHLFFPFLQKIIKFPQVVFFFCFKFSDPRIVAVNVNATTKCKTWNNFSHFPYGIVTKKKKTKTKHRQKKEEENVLQCLSSYFQYSPTVHVMWVCDCEWRSDSQTMTSTFRDISLEREDTENPWSI